MSEARGQSGEGPKQAGPRLVRALTRQGVRHGKWDLRHDKSREVQWEHIALPVDVNGAAGPKGRALEITAPQS